MSEKEVGKTAIEEHKSIDSYIIDIPESLERKEWSKCCIQRVRRRLRKVNEEAYTPQFVSIGPFHHHKPELLGMEPHKRRYLDKFCEQYGKSQDDLTDFIRHHHDEIRQSYAGTVTVKGEDFIKMVLVDACFIIELFLRNSKGREDDYIINGTGTTRSDIKRDLIMLENQLPYAFLKQLYDFVFNTQSPNSETTNDTGMENDQIGNIHPFSKHACKFFFCTEDEDVGWESDELKIKHFTDLERRALCRPKSDDAGKESENCLSYLCSAKKLDSAGVPGKESENRLSYLCSAKKLDSAGVHFFKSENRPLANLEIKASNLFSIPCLKSTRLGLPEFCVEDDTECRLRNVMALEQCLYIQETYICDYIRLLDQLINDTEDVDLLVEKEIVKNVLGSNDEVAKLVNKLGTEIFYDDNECYKEVCQKLNAHRHNWLNRTRATIERVYFKNCWTGSTTIVGFFVLLFTISATIKELFFR